MLRDLHVALDDGEQEIEREHAIGNDAKERERVIQVHEEFVEEEGGWGLDEDIPAIVGANRESGG